MDDIKRVFENSQIGFALVEKTGGFRYANKALSNILGYSIDELSQIDWQSITHPDDLLGDLALVADVINGIIQGYQLEKRYIRKNRSICYTFLSVSTLLFDDGSLDCFCSQITDVTQYVELTKKLDDSLKRKNELRLFQESVLKAIANDQFVLHYQGIIDLKTLKAVGYEALIRWQHPDMGLLYPNDFIEDCEQDPDIMLQLCQWVFKTACRDRAKLNGFLSINVSPKSLLHFSFIDMVSKYADKIDTPVVFLEITERVIANLDDTDVLKRIEQEGYGFFIDDFGQANSGLIQVIKIIKSIQKGSSVKVKIDIWFTEHILDQITYASMKVLIGLFHDIGVEVIAEGIETEIQLNAWRELGCEYGQGWLWGKAKAIA